MILLVKKNCPFCPTDLMDEVKRRGGSVFPVLRHPDGSGLICAEVGDMKFSELPKAITMFPALIKDDNTVIIGCMPIEEFLFQKELALCT